MAVAFSTFIESAISSANSTITTGNITVTGTDPALFITTASTDDASRNPSSATWNVATPENFTEVVAATGQSFFGASIWGLAAPTAATDNVTVTYPQTVDGFAVAVHLFTGVDGTTPTGNTQSGNGTSGEPSETLTSVDADDFCLDAVCVDSEGATNTRTAGTNQTKRSDITSNSDFDVDLSSSTQDGTDGGEMTWTISGTEAWIHVACVIKAAASAVTGTIAETLDGYTSTATGAVEVSGSSAETLDDFVSSVVATYGPSGTIAETLEDYVSAASGSSGSGVSGSIAETLEDFSSSADGVYKLNGSIAETLEDFSGSATGAMEVFGTIAEVLEDFTANAEGGLPGVDTGFINRGGVAFSVIKRRRRH